MVIYRLSALARVKIRGMLQVLGHSSCIISSYLKHVASERKIFGVRNQSTKDNVGTLPLFAYTTPDQPPRPLDFSTTDDLTARETVVTEFEFRNLFSANKERLCIIWNNKDISIDGKPVFYKSYYDSGICIIKDL